uniref:NADH dehydrogenase [ubiquinone] 1 beta subcomplex subunit 4 n=1 Tax=Heliconius erato TaxID=33431 RepID=L7WWD5_HELEA|nr:NADH:ubiquinone dehydrogenase-like protein [Heliconius erato]
MAEKYGISEGHFKLIQAQAARRADLRREFLKQRTNPWKNASEAGYVFDEAHQRYISMKVTQFDHFKPNRRTSIFGVCTVVIPMLIYGYIIKTDRDNREAKIRNGELLYKDRLFKLC